MSEREKNCYLQQLVYVVVFQFTYEYECMHVT
jgi:hypothetical protein